MATVKVIRETPPAEIPPIKTVILTLTADEAQTLRTVVGAITSDPAFTEQRRHVNAIFNALQEVGINGDLSLRVNIKGMHFGRKS